MKTLTYEQLKPYYGEKLFEGRKLCLYQRTDRREDIPPMLDHFELKLSSNRKLYIFEADIALFENCRAIIVGKNQYYSGVGFKIIDSLEDLNRLHDGSSRVNVKGNTLYTNKPGSWIGKGGSHVKLLSKYLGRVNIKKAEDNE
jgi:hypothetical protein